MSTIDEIEKLAKLKSEGAITLAEFDAQKERLLNPSQTAEILPPKSMWEWFCFGIKNYFKINARATRSEYWILTFGYLLINIILESIALSLSGFSIISGIFSLFMLIPLMTVYIRRMHDVGHSTLFAVIPLLLILFAVGAMFSSSALLKIVAGFSLILILILSIWIFILTFITSTPMDNKYGKYIRYTNNPAKKDGLSDLAWILIIVCLLPILGVVIIGGISGYTMAMTRFKADEVADIATKLGVLAQTKMDTDKSIGVITTEMSVDTLGFKPSNENIDYNSVIITPNNNQIIITMYNMDATICATTATLSPEYTCDDTTLTFVLEK